MTTNLGPTDRVKAIIANTLDDVPLPAGMEPENLSIAEELAAYVASMITLIVTDSMEINKIDRLLGTTDSVMVDNARAKLIFQRDQTDAQIRARMADVLQQVYEAGLVLDTVAAGRAEE